MHNQSPSMTASAATPPDGVSSGRPPGPLRLLIIALIYAILGTGGLALAIPPSYASPIFPAAGFALAAVLFYGNRALAGVWLGSLAMHILAPPYVFHISLTDTLIALGIATGATLQSWAGAGMVRRLLDAQWGMLSHEREATAFLFFGGVLACLASASLSVSTLYLAGAIAGPDFLHAWWTWYVGDTLGVLLCAPFTLFFLNRHIPLWQKRARTIILPLLTVLTMVALAFVLSARMENKDLTDRIAQEGRKAASRLEARLNNDYAILASLARFMEVNPNASYEQFERFTRQTLKDYPELQALSYNALVKHQERAAFEAAMAQTLPGGRFQITERNATGTLVPAGRRPEYVAVTYIAPLADNRPALGFDIASNPLRRAAIEQAQRASTLAITAPIRLVQADGKAPGFLSLLPARTPEGRVLGFAVAVNRSDLLVASAIGNSLAPGILLRIEDRHAPEAHRRLYGGSEKDWRGDYVWRGDIRVGDRNWTLEVAPNGEWLAHHRSWVAWSVGVAGLLFATLLQVLMLVATARTDLIQRKVEEQTAEILAKSRALEASEERYRHLFDESRVPMLLIDPEDGAILDANQAAADYYGYDRSELKKKYLPDINVLPEAEIKAGMEDACRQAREAFQFTHRLASGELRQVEVRSGPMEVGGRSLLYSIVQDITERTRLEAEVKAYQGSLEERVAQRTAELAASESNTRLILESTADGLFGLDLEGKISFINPAACRMLGYRAEDVIGREAHPLLHHSWPDGSPYPQAECPTLRSQQAGRVVTVGEEFYWRVDGTPLPVIYSAHPMVRDGVIVGSVVSFVDITERKATEEARDAARREAERLARVKSEFLANMSHEIRTPLNGVLGTAQVGFRRSADSKEYFGRILDSGRLLLGIINDILDFSKIEAGKLAVESVPFDPVALTRDAATMLSERAKAKGLEFDTDAEADLPRSCLGDPLRIEQILLNLLSNAVKFTEEGRVSLEVGRKEGRLCFTVADTGIGMTPEQMERAFAAFEQADGSTTRRFGGTGLGLTISRRLAELMGGEIRVESTSGQGCRFDLILPLEEAGPSQPETGRDAAPMPPSARLSGILVLAAEDNPINQLVLQDFLESEGALVTMAGDGLEVVAQVQSQGGNAFDVVLMDIQMPGMDGSEAARRIGQLAPHLPIIAQTAHALPDERDRILAAGMVDHISKPLELEDLVAAILRHAQPRLPT